MSFQPKPERPNKRNTTASFYLTKQKSDADLPSSSIVFFPENGDFFESEEEEERNGNTWNRITEKIQTLKKPKVVRIALQLMKL